MVRKPIGGTPPPGQQNRLPTPTSRRFQSTRPRAPASPSPPRLSSLGPSRALGPWPHRERGGWRFSTTTKTTSSITTSLRPTSKALCRATLTHIPPGLPATAPPLRASHIRGVCQTATVRPRPLPTTTTPTHPELISLLIPEGPGRASMTLQWDWWGWLVLASGTGRGESCRALTVKWYSHWIGHSVRGNTRQCAECPQGKSRHDSFLSISLFFSDSSAAECFPECDGPLTVNMKTYEYEILFLAFFWRIQKCFDKEEECLNFFSQDISHSPSGNETLGTL